MKPLFTRNTFAGVEHELGKRDMQELRGVEYAIVHRYEPKGIDVESADKHGNELMRNVVACLRIIRRMRQRVSFMRGSLDHDGKINVEYFEHVRELLEIPEAQKLFHLRVTDIELLKAVIPEFLQAMANEF